MHITPFRGAMVAFSLAGTVLLAACATDPAVSTAESNLVIGAVDLSDECPATVVIQTDWNPEAEQGNLYELIGPDPTIDTEKKAVSGPLMASGAYTGVNIEVRSGGPAIGFQSVSSQQYLDTDITLGYANTDEAVQLSSGQPTTAVFAPFEVGPQIIMWDPATYPEVESIADLGETDAYVRYFGGSTYMDFLTGSGLLSADRVDGGYDGTPANFLADGGTAAQQGFATVEPYIYENELPLWGKKVGFQLIHDAGYPIYASALAVRTAELDSLAPCLTKLVPVIQQATVDYYADSAATNALIVEAVTAFDNGWVYGAEVADYSVEAQMGLGLVGNGDDSTVGNFDLDRIQTVIDITMPLFAAAGVEVADEVSPDLIATNRFIDASIGFAE